MIGTERVAIFGVRDGWEVRLERSMAVRGERGEVWFYSRTIRTLIVSAS